MSDPVASIFTGRTATYVGRELRSDDGAGHMLERGLPLDVGDKTATWHYAGGGCC